MLLKHRFYPPSIRLLFVVHALIPKHIFVTPPAYKENNKKHSKR